MLHGIQLEKTLVRGGFHVQQLLMCCVYDLTAGGIVSGSNVADYSAQPAGSIVGGSSKEEEATKGDATEEVVAQPDAGLASGSD